MLKGSTDGSNLINTLTYVSYAHNRDKGMSHNDLVKILKLPADVAENFHCEYAKDLEAENDRESQPRKREI